MYPLVMILYLVTVTVGESEKSTLLKLKSDVDKVGKHFENLVFDIVKKILDDTGMNHISEEYYTIDEDKPTQKAVTQHSMTEKILNNLLENTTEGSTTKETTKHTVAKKNSSAYNTLLLNRLKRSVNNGKNSSMPFVANKPMGDSPIPNNSQSCSTKCGEEQTSERQRLEDLKEEIKKLHDLVVLLKDQQRILSLLNTNNVDNDAASRFGAKDLLKILDYINTKNIRDQKLHDPNKKREDSGGKISTHEELAGIKNELRETVEVLNKTRESLTKERKKGLLLEKELSDQRLDLNFLKMMVRRVYKSQMNFPRGNIDDDILGAAQPSSKDLEENNEVVGNINDVERESDDELRLGNGARETDVDDLERILRKLKEPRKTSIESKMLELEKEIEKKKQDEDTLKQLKILEKHLERRIEPHSSNTGPHTDSELLKKLLLTLQMTRSPKSRTLDEDIELELQKLQDAIDNLRPNDGQELHNEILPTEEDETKQFQAMFNKLFGQRETKQEDESKRFQAMLDKMLEQERKKEEDSAKQFQTVLDMMVNRGKNNGVKVSPDVDKVNGLLLREVMELRKKIASIEKSQFNGENVYSADNYVPQIADIYGSEPGGLNYPPSLPYMNPGHRKFMNQVYKAEMNVKPNNRYYTDHISPFNNYMSTKFGNEKFVRTFEKPSWYNFEDMGKNIHHIHYEQSKRPENYQQKFAPSHQISYTIPNIHNNFKGRIYPPPNSFSNPSMPQTVYDPMFFPREEGNQFFHESEQKHVYAKPIPETFYHSDVSSGGGAIEPEPNPPKTGENVVYIYQKVEDLKTQIYNLQNVIDSLNTPNYNQTPQDKEVIASLEKQINDLKGAIDNIDADTIPATYVPSPPNFGHNYLPLEEQPYSNKHRRRRSVENDDAESDSQIYDQVVTGIRQLIFDRPSGQRGNRSSYEDIQRRIDNLRYELEAKTRGQRQRSNPIVSSNLYQPPHYQQNHFFNSPVKSNVFDVSQSRKNDIFTSIIVKILDKIIAATPALLERFFGHGFAELSNFEGYSAERGNYNYNVDYGGQNDVQKLFRSLGFFGYGPLILLKVIDGFTTFVKILKRNAFFRNFLLPALVLLVVAGAVIFLIWWLQPSVEHNDPNRDLHPQQLLLHE